MENTITKEKNVKDMISSIRWSDILLCIMAFIVARVDINGIFYTFGIGYMGSLYFNRDLRRWGSVFTILGLLSLNIFRLVGFKYIMVAGLVIIARKYIEYSDEEFSNLNQALIVFASLFVVGVAENTIRGLSAIGMLTSLLEGIVGAGLVIILSYGVRVIKVNRKLYINHKEATSLMLIIAAVLIGTSDVYVELPWFIAIYLKDVIAFVMLIAVIYLGGMTLGATVGIVISMILVMMGYMPMQYVMVMGMATLIGGLLKPIGRVGVVAGVGVGTLLGFIMFNSGIIDRPFLGAYIVGGIVSLILPEKYFGLARWFEEQSKEEEEEVHLERVQNIMTERLIRFTAAFSKITDSFSRVYYKKESLDEKDVSYIIEDTKEKVCNGCAMYKFCWERDCVRTYNTAYGLVQTAEENGIITKRDISQKFREDCGKAEHFAYTLNFKVDIHKHNIRWENKLIENRLLMSEQLKAVRDNLYRLIAEVEEEVKFNKEEEVELVEKLRMKGLKVRDVVVVENRTNYKKVEVYVPYCKRKEYIEKSVLACVQSVSDYRMKIESHKCSEQGCKMTLVSEKVFNMSAGAMVKAKQEISGDVHSYIELTNGRYLMGLADGMGSGQKARFESMEAIELLEDFIDAEIEKDIAIKVINSMLILNKDEENFSTLDFAVIDLYTGVAEFLKVGGSTTFILRGNHVETIKANTLPVGMLRNVEPKIKNVSLKDGDIIVMVTDGVLATRDDVVGLEETFKHFILEAKGGDPQYIAEYLMERSCNLLGVEERDDMSIIVGKIWKNIKGNRGGVKIS